MLLVCLDDDYDDGTLKLGFRRLGLEYWNILDIEIYTVYRTLAELLFAEKKTLISILITLLKEKLKRNSKFYINL